MVPRLSQRIQELSESATIGMSRRSREMREAGIDVISLSLGEPDFFTPDFVKEAAKAAIDANYSHYPPIPGYRGLREAIQHKFKRDNSLDYTPEQIVVSTGAKQSIANAVLCLINPGDEVLLPAPYWVSYVEIVKLAGGVPVVIPTSLENDYKVSRSQLEAHFTEKTRLLIFSSPCNPTGSVFRREELAQIAAFLRSQPQVMAIADEIYELISFEEKAPSLATFPGVYEQVITVNGLSKGFAMTGWRCGYLGAPAWLAEACTKMQGQITSAACSITQKAALAALMADPNELQGMKEAFKARRDLVIGLLQNIPGFKTNRPGGAFYLFPEVKELLGSSSEWGRIDSSEDLCFFLLEKARVALVPGEAFGSPGAVRLSYASAEAELREALRRIEEAVKNLKK